MRLVTQRAFGGPEVLEIVEVDRPEPGPGEVLVRVRAASVNFGDTNARAGRAPSSARFRSPWGWTCPARSWRPARG